MSKSFTFKQFHIDIGSCGMPVSTDGVLLGAWTNISECSQILDIGTGTGLLSLMSAQRNSDAHVDAIELMPIAAEVARLNFSQSPWKERLVLIHQDFLSYQTAYKYDAIICNPPYFNNGEQSLKGERSTARHTDSLPFDKLLLHCKTLISSTGRASFILPVFEGEIFIKIAKSCDFHLTKITKVKTTEKNHRLAFLLSYLFFLIFIKRVHSQFMMEMDIATTLLS